MMENIVCKQEIMIAYSFNFILFIGKYRTRVIIIKTWHLFFTCKEKHSLRESWWDIGFEGNWWCKKQGNKVLSEEKM